MSTLVVGWQRARSWWSSTDVSDTNLASLGLITSAIAVEGIAILIWRHPGHRVEMAANGLQLVAVLLGAPVAIERLRSDRNSTARQVGARRIVAANFFRRLNSRWRWLVGAGFAAVSIAFLASFVAAAIDSFALLHMAAWFAVIGILVALWGWIAALIPRRYRTVLPPTVAVLSPAIAATSPKHESAFALAAAACLVVSCGLQFAALY